MTTKNLDLEREAIHLGEPAGAVTLPMSEIPAFLLELEATFNAAMISNDVDRIAACVSDDWLLVTPEAGPIPRNVIFDAIASGRLTHAAMTKQAHHAQIAGDMAWVTGRGQNSGTFRGQPMQADEWITDVYHHRGGVWRCVLTHLTPAKVTAPRG